MLWLWQERASGLPGDRAGIWGIPGRLWGQQQGCLQSLGKQDFHSKGSTANPACHSNPLEHFWRGWRVQEEVVTQTGGTELPTPGSPQPWHSPASLKISLVITTALGGLARPVSPKNQGVDSRRQMKAKRARLVPPLRLAVQGLCHSWWPLPPGSPVRDLGLPKHRHGPRFRLFPCSALRSP